MSDSDKRMDVPDPEQGFDWAAFFKGSGGKVVIGVVIVAAVAGCIYGALVAQRDSRTEAAWEAMAKAGMDTGKLQGLLQEYAGLPVAAHVRYRLGIALCGGDPGSASPERRAQAESEFRAVVEQHPESVVAPLAQVQLGWVLEEQAEDLRATDADAARGKLAEARGVYYDAFSKFPGSFAAEVAKGRYDRLQGTAAEAAKRNDG